MPQGGAEGMLLTSRGRVAGYGLYLFKGKPVFLWNLIDLERIKWEGPEALAPGKHAVSLDFKYGGLGAGTLAFNNMSDLGRPDPGRAAHPVSSSPGTRLHLAWRAEERHGTR